MPAGSSTRPWATNCPASPEMPALQTLIVFLGNPGPEHAGNRHNLGFMTAERFLPRTGGGPLRRKFKGRFWTGAAGAASIGVLLPSTFMNSSGESVLAAVKTGAAGVDDVVVVYDDMDLAFGQLRIRRGGASGGHLGVESIIDSLESRAFVRLKLGVGRPPPGVDPIDYLLSDFRDDERPLVSDLIERAVEALIDLLRQPLERVMNHYNRVPAPE